MNNKKETKGRQDKIKVELSQLEGSNTGPPGCEVTVLTLYHRATLYHCTGFSFELQCTIKSVTLVVLY